MMANDANTAGWRFQEFVRFRQIREHARVS